MWILNWKKPIKTGSKKSTTNLTEGQGASQCDVGCVISNGSQMCNFILGLNYYFPLLSCMVIYGNEF